MSTSDELPPLFGASLSELLGGAVPDEPRASCSSCAMCAPAGEPVSEGNSWFDPVGKCCTWVPELANYLVGGILADEDPLSAAGRASVLARISAGAATPLGLVRTAHERAPGDDVGEAGAPRCPHLVERDGQGQCGIHRHRGSGCATWFCKHERGERGRALWSAAHRYGAALESALAQHCLLQLDLADGEWGQWRGREVDFYRACAGVVARVPLDQVRALGGSQLRMAAQLVRAAAAAWDAPLPPLRTARLRVLSVSGDRCLVESYSRTDPLELSGALLGLLRHFDGRPVAETLAAIAADENVEIEEGVVRRLADFGVLLPAGEP
jgi:hypothetical protein